MTSERQQKKKNLYYLSKNLSIPPTYTHKKKKNIEDKIQETLLLILCNAFVDTVLIPVSPAAPSQDFPANNAVTNHFSLMPHTCLAPLAQPSIQLNP